MANMITLNRFFSTTSFLLVTLKKELIIPSNNQRKEIILFCLFSDSFMKKGMRIFKENSVISEQSNLVNPRF